jgi:integrase
VVLTMQEAWAMLARLEGMKVLVAKLLWRSGLRLMKAFRLRVHDLDRNRHALTVRDRKGGPDHLRSQGLGVAGFFEFG